MTSDQIDEFGERPRRSLGFMDLLSLDPNLAQNDEIAVDLTPPSPEMPRTIPVRRSSRRGRGTNRTRYNDEYSNNN